MAKTTTQQADSLYYIGLMSGTSLDGIDGVLVAFSLHESNTQPRIIAKSHRTYSDTMRAQCLALLEPTPNEIHLSQTLAIQHSQLASEVAADLLNQQPSATVAAIGNHGQTLRHLPNASQPYSLQIGNGAVLAELTGLTTVMDFRSRDIAAGGQGAPLVPAFHHAVFRSNEEARAIVNIGGIANVSLLSQQATTAPIGFDTGPGNALMDEWAQQHLGKPYDKNGAWAASGVVQPALLDALLSEPFFSAPNPKSTGRDLFNSAWLKTHLRNFEAAMRPQDVQATLCALTARSIMQGIDQCSTAIQTQYHALYLCGGGAQNTHLIAQLQQLTKRPVKTTMQLGYDPQCVEACAFAWLAKQAIEGQPSNAPSATGAQHAVPLGAIYPA